MTRPELIDPEVAREWWEEGRVQFVDARPPAEHDRSRERIPGAIHIDPGSGASMDAAISALPRERVLIAYCDEPGHAGSTQIARRCRELGHGDGLALRGGLRGWQEAGYPTAVTAPPARIEEPDHVPARHVIDRTDEALVITVAAQSVEDLFSEAGVAVTELIADVQPTAEPSQQHVHLAARDREALLLLWVLDLLARSARQRCAFPHVKALAVVGAVLDAELQGAPVATWHCAPGRVPAPQVGLGQGSGGQLHAVLRFDARLPGGRSANRHRLPPPPR
jgi:rhodanese-related sulfurtransferase/SHS2 domain-containing protein